MASILKTPSHKAQLGRHGHDLSRRILFTSSVGHLLPVLFDYLSPGDKIRINDNLFTKTQPLTSPAFCRIKEHVEYFFVPMEQINCYFGQAFYGISDLTSSLQSTNSGQQSLPTHGFGATIDDFLLQMYAVRSTASGTMKFQCSADGDVVWSVSVGNCVFDMFGIPELFNTIRLLDLFLYGHNFFNQGSTAQGQNSGNYFLNLDAFAVYQKIYYDYYRLSQFESNNVFAYNFDNALRNSFTLEQSMMLTTSANSPSSPVISDLLSLHYRPLKKDFFTNVLQSPLYVLAPSAQISPNSYNYTAFSSSDLNSYILSAYGVQFQQSTVAQPDAKLVSNISVSASGVNGQATELNNGSFYSVQQLRLAFAYDKMMSITQRAGKHYDDQTLAHFGVKVPQGVSGECYFLGGHTSDLNIAEVVATAAGDNSGNTSSLGELAGRGYGASSRNRDIKFTAPCHGYLMAIYSSCPEISYTSYGLHRLHTYASINDFPHPEFDNIGMQPLWDFQINNQAYYQGEGISTPLNSANFYGWQYRWSELKMAYDVTTSGFVESLQNWAVNYVPGQFSYLRYLDGSTYRSRSVYYANFYCSPDILDNIFGLMYSPVNWWSSEIVNSDDVLTLSEFTIRNFTGTAISSTVVNPAFMAQEHRPGVLWDDSIVYSRDPLYHSLDFRYYKTSWMSTYGLPSL